MNLFPCEPTRNLLPFDGIVNYYGPILRPCDAEDYLEALLATVRWKSDEAIVCGKHIVTARKVAWYGDSSYSYTYSARPRSRCRGQESYSLLRRLLKIKPNARSIRVCATCTSSEGMGWHSDDEKALGKDTAIGSLSLGAQRKFSFRHKKKDGHPVSIQLENGSLLVMRGTTQTFWQHSVPKTTKLAAPRINLTFQGTSAPSQ
jgi:alkylated DNA repair dioxygenase AlkB